MAINVLDPDIHRSAEAVSTELTFTGGRATLTSDTIILDTLTLDGKVEGVDYSVDYDFTKGQVILDSIADEKIIGAVIATYYTVVPTAVTADDIIGGVSAAGVYTGLGCIALIYQTLNLIPNLIICPKWGEIPAVYEAMIVAGTRINGHWDAFPLADMPIVGVETIEDAIKWRTANGYTSERTKVFWPRAKDTAGRVWHPAVLAAWRMMLVDAANNGVPMETPSNKTLPIAAQYFGAESKNRGFDEQRANDLNANGITTVAFVAHRWVLWGPHTAAFTHGAVTDNRNIFDNSIRMMMYVSNSFQEEHALSIDGPMTRAMKDTILNREQEKMDALAVQGAFIARLWSASMRLTTAPTIWCRAISPGDSRERPRRHLRAVRSRSPTPRTALIPISRRCDR